MIAALLTCALATTALTPALPPVSGRTITYDTHEVTWPAADQSPDGKTILVDILGDIYALDAGGGTARPVLTGAPYETQPVFSPDGAHIAFISDRSGPENLWIAGPDGSQPRRISGDEDGAPLYSSPAWSPDGRTLYVSRMTYGVLAFELWAYDVATGKGRQLTRARPTGFESHDDRRNAMGAVASPDGRYLYYSVKLGTTWTPRKLPHWQIVRRDLETGAEDAILTAPGGAMHPALSHDGRWLAYGTREEGRTVLRLRDLETSADRLLLAPVDPDGQIGGYYSDLLPRFSFAPDDKSLLLGLNGGLKRLDLARGMVAEIPFTATVSHQMGPQLRSQQPVETGPVHLRVAQHPRLSPDGRHILFGAAGRLYVATRGSRGTPRALAIEGPAWQASWSPDGKAVTYVTWTAQDGGQVWRAQAFGPARAQALTPRDAAYSEPIFTRDGHTVVALRASQQDRLNALTESGPAGSFDIVRIDGGGVQVITHAQNAHTLRLDHDPARVQYDADGWIRSVGLDGRKPQALVRLLGQAAAQYVDAPSPVDDARLSDDGRQALVRSGFQLFVVPVPATQDGKPPVVTITHPSSGAIRITAIGADDMDWSADGQRLTWSAGNRFLDVPLAVATSAGQQAEARATRTVLDVVLPRDVPQGSILLSNATIATMRGEETIPHGDILITANRIVAVGPVGTLHVPAQARVIDLSGKYVLPGFVDVHAHWFETRRNILDIGHWDFAANLAYGVTSGRDVQSFDTDVFAYADMIEAGLMVGPRAFSTGPGVFVNTNIRSRQDADAILSRYRDLYHTRNIKEYMAGNRAQRRYLIEAATDLGMMPTTEGASDYRLDITQMLDGYPGNEHALPIAPLHDDVMQMLVRTRISYTPTMLEMYGAPTALGDMVIRHQGDVDDKLRRFVPGPVIAVRTGSRNWTSPVEQTYPLFAAQAIAIQRAGGLLGVGSHGMAQGLAYHWEMEAMASGGARPMEVLHAATIGSAEVIGHATDIGSIEPGKLADILVLDKDPMADIRNTQTLAMVMKNGRLYDAATLDEIAPTPRQQPLPWFAKASHQDR